MPPIPFPNNHLITQAYSRTCMYCTHSVYGKTVWHEYYYENDIIIRTLYHQPPSTSVVVTSNPRRNKCLHYCYMCCILFLIRTLFLIRILLIIIILLYTYIQNTHIDFRMRLYNLTLRGQAHPKLCPTHMCV